MKEQRLRLAQEALDFVLGNLFSPVKRLRPHEPDLNLGRVHAVLQDRQSSFLEDWNELLLAKETTSRHWRSIRELDTTNLLLLYINTRRPLRRRPALEAFRGAPRKLPPPSRKSPSPPVIVEALSGCSRIPLRRWLKPSRLVLLPFFVGTSSFIHGIRRARSPNRQFRLFCGSHSNSMLADGLIIDFGIVLMCFA
ncbi:hypothetical protein KSP40_PGU015460 [Platanthera guangdongensis]|uniref:Uncharacterized protein n=1 Tax=Platanthera guangdongensis TaxID=2320717 RepID=A0ABR2MES5_9ASPA